MPPSSSQLTNITSENKIDINAVADLMGNAQKYCVEEFKEAGIDPYSPGMLFDRGNP